MVFVSAANAKAKNGKLKSGVKEITDKNGRVRYVSSVVAKKEVKKVVKGTPVKDVKKKEVKNVEKKEVKNKGVVKEKVIKEKSKKKKEEVVDDEEKLKLDFD